MISGLGVPIPAFSDDAVVFAADAGLGSGNGSTVTGAAAPGAGVAAGSAAGASAGAAAVLFCAKLGAVIASERTTARKIVRVAKAIPVSPQNLSGNLIRSRGGGEKPAPPSQNRVV
jgi:hypothetical protein